MSDLLTIECTLSNTDVPCLWESGGEDDNGIKGSSTIICNNNGTPKRAIFVRKNSFPSIDKNHALIPIMIGDIVIKTEQINKKFNIFVYKIENIKNNLIDLKKQYLFSSGEWDKTIPDYLEEPVKLSKHKALTTLCSEPFYIKTK